MPPSVPRRVRLTGPWQVYPLPLDADFSPGPVPEDKAFDAPECAHLQPVLYPAQPYWGDHLRALNAQAWIYCRTFAAPDLPFKRARLRFEGVDYFAEVWVNGSFAGRHEGHNTPFTLDVTGLVRPGAIHTLVVRVTSPWDPPNPQGSYPVDHVIRGLVKGLYEHGEGVIPPNVNPIGIWRPTWLLLDDGVSLDRVRIRAGIDGAVNVRLSVTNAGGQPWSGALTLRAFAENHDGPGADLVLPLELAPGEHAVEQTLRLPDPRLWWPWDQGRPDLYRLTALLRGESGRLESALRETFGLRTVELERSPDRFTYVINGRPMFVRGSGYMPGLYLSQRDRGDFVRDVNLARAANLNLLRVHVHISPPDLYDVCDRAGMLIWQDFELNWMHHFTPEFEARALAAQRALIDLLGNHPAIITWACHNEPTMVFAHRENVEQRPDPALYADAQDQDPTRPVFICSGQMEEDWRRSGDAHTYYGALWTARYTDVYRRRCKLNTEFGAETPAAAATLKAYPFAWERLRHLEGQIETLWQYQAELIRYHVEHFRRLRAAGSAGYVHFWLVDLVPQVGCGVLDYLRQPKGGYEALRRASQPLLVMLEHDGRRPRALWVCNDTPHAYPGASVHWQVYDARDRLRLQGETPCDVIANATQRVADAAWRIAPAECARVELALRNSDGLLLVSNAYHHPFRPMLRPRGYPWKFDPVLGTKVFDRPGAPSLADQSSNRLIKLIPLRLREQGAEWAMRQQLPLWVLSLVARLTALLVR